MCCPVVLPTALPNETLIMPEEKGGKKKKYADELAKARLKQVQSVTVLVTY